MKLGSCLGTLKDGDYWQLPFGKLIVHGNELHVLTENADPAAFSLLGFTEGKVSWKDDAGLEKVCLGLRMNANGDGEIYIGCWSQARYEQAIARGGAWIDKANDYAMMEVGTINPDTFELRTLFKPSAGLMGAAAGPSDRMISADGRYFTVQQSDGDFVTYDTQLGAVGDKDAAIWSAWGGKLR